LLQLCRTLSGFLKLINNNLFIKFNPLTPVLAVTGRDVSWPFFHFWLHHQNWHHLCSTSAGGKDLSNDTQIRSDQISPMEPEVYICTKMLKKLREKLRAKFPATTCGYSMVKIAHHDDALSEFFKLEASPVEGQSLQRKEKKRTKRKGEKKKLQKSKSLKT